MKNKDISIEIYTAKSINFQVNSENNFDSELNLENVNLSLNAEFRLDESNSTVAISINLDVLLKESDQNLFSLKSFFEFGVFDLKDVLIERKQKKVLEPEFARKLLNISIGGSRGMLSVYLSSTPYSKFTLPIANIPDDFFDN
jgi:hypothetical protein